MPELPEVQTVVQTLRPHVVGQRIECVDHLRADIVTPIECDWIGHVTRRQIVSLRRRGKRIVFALDDRNQFYIHLGMTGRLSVETTPEAVRAHSHLILHLLPAGAYLHFSDPRRFGGIWWLGNESSAGDMGPEPLTMRPAQLFRRLSGTRRAIKTTLLDQTVVAGIGNIYADEALFHAGIHPTRPANTLSIAEVARLNRSIKFVLRQAIRYRGSTLRDYVDADGVKGAYQKRHKVYDRTDQPCRRCRMSIHRVVLTGRSTHYCPQCQPARSVAQATRL